MQQEEQNLRILINAQRLDFQNRNTTRALDPVELSLQRFKGTWIACFQREERHILFPSVEKFIEISSRNWTPEKFAKEPELRSVESTQIANGYRDS